MNSGVVFLRKSKIGFLKIGKNPKAAFEFLYTPNANMADHSVVARGELHESEASKA